MPLIGSFAPITNSIRLNTQRFSNISDAVNLQNVNGAKHSRLTFSTLLGDNNPSASSNVFPGSGLKADVRQNISAQGAINSTGRSLDFSINGPGFFAVRPTLERGEGITNDTAQHELYLTRNGSFNLKQVSVEEAGDNAGDEPQYIVDSDGHYVMGWQAPLGGSAPEPTLENLTPMQLNPEAMFLQGQATSNVDMNINLPHDTSLVADSKYPQIITVYDNESQPHFINLEFSYSGDENEWNFTPYLVDGNGVRNGDVTPANIDITFNRNGRLTDNTALTLGFAGNEIALDLGEVTSFGNSYGLKTITQNGYPDGDMQFYEINSSGVILGTFDNGLTAPIAQIPILDVANRDLLKPYNSSGGPKFSLSEQNMELQIYDLVNSSHAKIHSGTLELSTIDLANVFTEMIETQHSFSIANNALQIINDMTQVAYRLKS